MAMSMSAPMWSTISLFPRWATVASTSCAWVSHQHLWISSSPHYHVSIPDEIAVPRECPTDYYFDARDQECVPLMEVECIGSCKNRGLSSFCYDRTCTKYVLCFDGTPVIRQCSDGLQYNALTDRCDYPQYVDCVDNLCSRNNNPDDIVFIPSKARCDKYYICMDGLPQVQNCTSGLQYNPSTQSCDFPSKVNCTVRVFFYLKFSGSHIKTYSFHSGGEPSTEYPALCPSSATSRRHWVSIGGRPLYCPPEASGCVLLLPEWTWSHLGLHTRPGVRCQARGVPWTTPRGLLVTRNKDPIRFQTNECLYNTRTMKRKAWQIMLMGLK